MTSSTAERLVHSIAGAIADVLCDFDLTWVVPDGFTPELALIHRRCTWKRIVSTGGDCLGLMIDEAMQHLQEAHSG